MSVSRTIFRVLTFAIVVSADARAQVDVSLPLAGYFRAGRYMPVQLAPRDGLTTLAGEGVIPTDVSGGGVATVAPVLVVETGPRTLAADGRALDLRELRDDDVLVGYASPPAPDVAPIFPGKNVIAIQLDPALLAAAVPVLLEPLDLVVLDRLPDAIDATSLSYYLSSGVGFLVRQANRPDERWPWRNAAGGWLLRAAVRGPRGALVGEAAYLPAQSWDGGVPGATRRAVALAGALVGILSLGAALLPRRLAMGALLAVTVVSIAILAEWQNQLPAVRSIRGQVAVEHGETAQWDAWTYFASARGGRGSTDFQNAVGPALVDARQAGDVNLRLHWGGTWSQRRWTFDVPPGGRLAFLSRTYGGGSGTQPVLARTALTSPMAPLARALYAGDGYEPVAEIAQRPDWPIVVVVRQP